MYIFNVCGEEGGEGMCATVCLWRSEDNLEKSVLFFDHVGFVGSRDGIQPVRLGSECLSHWLILLTLRLIFWDMVSLNVVPYKLIDWLAGLWALGISWHYIVPTPMATDVYKHIDLKNYLCTWVLACVCVCVLACVVCLYLSMWGCCCGSEHMCLEREPSGRSFGAGVRPLWTVWCGLGCRLWENKYVLLTTGLSPQSHTQLLVWVLGVKFRSSCLCGRHLLTVPSPQRPKI